MLLKMAAFDVFLAPTAYLRNSWNVLDATVVALGVAEWLLEAFPPASANSQQLKVRSEADFDTRIGRYLQVFCVDKTKFC